MRLMMGWGGVGLTMVGMGVAETGAAGMKTGVGLGLVGLEIDDDGGVSSLPPSRHLSPPAPSPQVTRS